MSKSAKKRPRLPKSNPKPDEEEVIEDPKLPIILSSDDDDQSLKIVQVACCHSSSSATEVKEKINMTTGRKGAQLNGLENVEKEKKVEDGAFKESDATIETAPSKSNNNIVLQKEKDFISKKGGRRAKDCPESSTCGSQNDEICLNCGDSGHEMFSCKVEYSLDDLKEIQCYVCKSFGHLCCANYVGEGSRKVSCYRCGQLGHSGLDCARVHEQTGSIWTPSACFMCRQEAHMACKCTGLSKKQKRKMDLPTSKKKKKSKRIRNKTQPSSSHQPKPVGRGGWITQDPHAYNNYNHVWGSANTLAMLITNNIFHGGNGYQPSSDRSHGGSGYNLGYNNPVFYTNQGNFRYGNAGSNGYQHTFSAPRYGNASNYAGNQNGWGYYPNRFS